MFSKNVLLSVLAGLIFAVPVYAQGVPSDTMATSSYQLNSEKQEMIGVFCWFDQYGNLQCF